MGGRGTVTELGPDLDVVATADREALPFDLGLGLLQATALGLASASRPSWAAVLDRTDASKEDGAGRPQSPGSV